MRFFIYQMVFLTALVVLGQEADTVFLEGVTVEGSVFHRFTTGANVRSIEIDEEDNDLSDVLGDQASIYFKTYGSSQLSSISFRGTSAGQTNVLWHGIPANYPTLGEMDFSQWPAWFMETVDMHPGSAGALYGSGSIGGTVLIDSWANQSLNKEPLLARVEIGSFGYFFTGAKSNYGSEDWGASSKVFYQQVKNDFPYQYQGEKRTQRNGENNAYGFQQKFNFQKGDHRFLVDGMYTQNNREIQPTKESPNTNNTLDTENLRIAFVHRREKSTSSWSNTLSFMSFSTIFNDTLETFSRQYSFLSTYWLPLSEHLSVQIGSNANLYRAKSSNYFGLKEDLQLAAFASVLWEPVNWWSGSLNLRQSFYKQHTPFTPSLGSEFILFQNDEWRLTTTQHVGTGFKYPTLNQLHWRPGGNPDLVHEESFALETGAKLIRSAAFGITASVNAYKTWSEDWIYWIPAGSITTPDNFRDVLLQGIEVAASIERHLGMVHAKCWASYAFTQSLNQTEPYKGQYLIYVPLHNAAARWEMTYANWRARISGQYTGKRYTTFDNLERFAVNGFTLFDLSVSRSIDFQHFKMSMGVSVDNLLDKDYENIRNLAMPGRNYQMNFSLKL